MNFLIKTEAGLSIVDEQYLDSIDHRVMAISLARDCYESLQVQLLNDAKTNTEGYIGKMKVTKSLDRAINYLDSRFPNLKRDLKTLKYRGQRLYSC